VSERNVVADVVVVGSEVAAHGTTGSLHPMIRSTVPYDGIVADGSTVGGPMSMRVACGYGAIGREVAAGLGAALVAG
jgi:hypothetical protein